MRPKICIRELNCSEGDQKKVDKGNAESLCYPSFEKQLGDALDWETPVD